MEASIPTQNNFLNPSPPSRLIQVIQVNIFNDTAGVQISVMENNQCSMLYYRIPEKCYCSLGEKLTKQQKQARIFNIFDHNQKQLILTKWPTLKIKIKSSNFFETISPQAQIKQADNQQCAFTSLKIIEFILDYEYICSYQKKILELIQSLDVGQQTKRLFISLFVFDGNYSEYNRKIFTQKRFQNAAINQKYIIYHLTYVAINMFQIFIKPFSRQRKMIYGTSGSGKSMTTSLFIILSNYIQNYKQVLRVSQEQNPSKRIMDLRVLFQKIGKMFYFNIECTKDNKHCFVQSIKSQVPYRLKKQLIQVNDTKLLIQKIAQYYSPYKPIFLLDGINVYYSSIRIYKQNPTNQSLKNELDEITELLKDLWNLKIIFTSSENVEKTIAKNSPDKFINIFKKQNSCSFHSISDKINETSYAGFSNRLQIIQFQLEKKIASNNIFSENQKQELIKQKAQSFQLLSLQADLHITVKKQFPNFIFLTHEKIAHYFNNNDFSQEQLIQMFRIDNKLVHQLLQFFNGMLKYIVQIIKQQYLHFINKGDDEAVGTKLLSLMKLRYTARKQSLTSPHQEYFCCKMQDKNVQGLALNQNYIEINYQQTGDCIIYINPKFFLEITSFCTHSSQFVKNIIPKLLGKFVSNRGWLGESFDITIVNYLSEYSVVFKLQNEIMAIKKYDNFDNVFQHFYMMNSKKDIYRSIYCRFYKIFGFLNQLDSKQSDCYICLKPNTIKSNALKHQQNMSQNSQVIDLLFIKKMETNRFIFKSVDFCLSFNKQYIKEKLQKSEKFFNKFVEVYEGQKTIYGINYVNDLLKKEFVQDQKQKRQENQSLMDIQPPSMITYEFYRIEHLILAPQAIYEKQFSKSEIRNGLVTISVCPIQQILQSYAQTDFLNMPQDFLPEMMEWLASVLKTASIRFRKSNRSK